MTRNYKISSGTTVYLGKVITLDRLILDVNVAQFPTQIQAELMAYADQFKQPDGKYQIDGQPVTLEDIAISFERSWSARLTSETVDLLPLSHQLNLPSIYDPGKVVIQTQPIDTSNQPIDLSPFLTKTEASHLYVMASQIPVMSNYARVDQLDSYISQKINSNFATKPWVYSQLASLDTDQNHYFSASFDNTGKIIISRKDSKDPDFEIEKFDGKLDDSFFYAVFSYKSIRDKLALRGSRNDRQISLEGGDKILVNLRSGSTAQLTSKALDKYVFEGRILKCYFQPKTTTDNDVNKGYLIIDSVTQQFDPATQELFLKSDGSVSFSVDYDPKLANDPASVRSISEKIRETLVDSIDSYLGKIGKPGLIIESPIQLTRKDHAGKFLFIKGNIDITLPSSELWSQWEEITIYSANRARVIPSGITLINGKSTAFLLYPFIAKTLKLVEPNEWYASEN